MQHNCCCYATMLHHYRPQRSWGKVIFSQASVILLTGGSASVHAGIPPGPDTPLEQTPWEQTPPRSRPPRSRPPQELTPPRSRPPGSRPPPGADSPGAEHAGRYGQHTGGTHPTGMQSCFENDITIKLRCHHVYF